MLGRDAPIINNLAAHHVRRSDWASVRWERMMLIGLLGSCAAMGVGTAWDIYWHAALIIPAGEPFWSPPHRVLYSGAVIPGFIGAILVVSRFQRINTARLAFLSAPAYFYVGLGGLVMAAGGAFDAFWHRYVGDRTIWSPPHIVALAGGIMIASGAIVALAQAEPRGVLPRRLSAPCVLLLLAGLVLAAHTALVSTAVAVFFPQATGIGFYGVRNPYVLAVLASLVLPPLVTGYREFMGKDAFVRAALVAIGIWSAQEPLHRYLTGHLAGAEGFALKTIMIPHASLKLSTFAFLLLPAVLADRVAAHRSWIAGALSGVLYIAALHFWLWRAGMSANPSGGAVLAAIIGGAVAGITGAAAGRWLRRTTRPSGVAAGAT